MAQNRRYFIVYFTGLDGDGELRRGKVLMFVEDGGYVNEKFIHDKIVQEHGLQEPFITNINELSQSDFEDFVAEDTENPKPNETKNDNIADFL